MCPKGPLEYFQKTLAYTSSLSMSAPSHAIAKSVAAVAALAYLLTGFSFSAFKTFLLLDT